MAKMIAFDQDAREAIFTESLRSVVAGVNPVYLKNGIEKAVGDVVAKLKRKSVKVKGRKEMAQVATIARRQGWQPGL